MADDSVCAVGFNWRSNVAGSLCSPLPNLGGDSVLAQSRLVPSLDSRRRLSGFHKRIPDRLRVPTSCCACVVERPARLRFLAYVSRSDRLVHQLRSLQCHEFWDGIRRSLGVITKLTWDAHSLPQRPFPAQQVMVVLREPVCFVADVLQEPECVGAPAEPQWFVAAHYIYQFLFFRQREHQWRLDVERPERFESLSQLPDAAVDKQNIREHVAVIA